MPYANLKDPQSLNLYAYVGNQPVGTADADGHLSIIATGTLHEPWVTNFGLFEGFGADEGSGLTSSFSGWNTTAGVEVMAQQQAAVDSLVAAQGAARANPQNQPAGKTTHCNSATYQECGAMGANMGVFSGYPGWDGRANAVGKKLASSDDWNEVLIDQVQGYANKGVVVIGSYINPHGDGHLVTGRPEGIKGDNPGPGTGPLISNVGKTVGVMRYGQIFRKNAEVHFYVQK